MKYIQEKHPKIKQTFSALQRTKTVAFIRELREVQ